MPYTKLPVLSVSNFKKTVLLNPDFYIKTFREHKNEHPFIMEPHRHDFYMVMLFTKGKGTHTIDFTTYKIEPGSMFFISPGEMHSWKLSNDTDGFVIIFNSSFFLLTTQNKNISEFPFFSLESKMNFGKLNPEQIKNIKSLFETIYIESKSDLKQQTLIVRSYLDILFLKLAATFGTRKAFTTNTTKALIPKIENLIELNYKNRLPANFYAQELSLSVVQLNKLITDFLGKSINELIHDRLILEGKRLLIYTTLTVSEISFSLNYSDNSNFNKFFKKATGHTPEQFRKRFA